MPFEGRSAMSLKAEFVRLAMVEGANMAELCERFGVSRGCGYKWLERFRQQGDEGLAEYSRRPHSSPSQTKGKTEAAVLAVRSEHPAWGGRKIAAVLKRSGSATPAPSTITAILRRHGYPIGRFGGGQAHFIRFEHPHPNDLWQMDFKGHVAMRQGRLHPLTVLDDHSRYAIAVEACADETGKTVKTRLQGAFRRYGLPWRMAVDNGSPWGDAAGGSFTPLTVWLIECGIAVSHSRPYHPQTLGKDERFHRSLNAEALCGLPFESLNQAQQVLERWRHIYNTRRPHEAIDLQVPADRYRLSPRVYSEHLQPFEYAQGDQLRIVQMHGRVSFQNRVLRASRAFIGKTVAFRPTAKDGVYDLFFRHQLIKTIDLNALDQPPESVHDVSEHLSTMSPV
jgi:transposase InsO family protein